MGRMGRRQIIYIYNENIFDGVFFRKENFFDGVFFLEKKIFLMGRGTYTETDNWVAAKISWEPRIYLVHNILGATSFSYTLSERLQIQKIVIFSQNWVKSQKLGQIPIFGPPDK